MPKLLVLKQLRYAFQKYTQPSTGKPLSKKCSGELLTELILKSLPYICPVMELVFLEGS